MAASEALLVHGLLMVVAWLFILPIGVLVARYFKVLRGQDFPRELDNPFWFYFHRGSQYAGMAIALVGLGMAWTTLGTFDYADDHAVLGLAVMILGVLQVVSTWLRGTKGGPTDLGADPARPETWRGDHYDMTRRRVVFEGWHKTFGYFALILAVPTAMMGADRLGAPHWALPFLLLPSIGLFILAVFLERRWVDTYQAIWGLDTRHPGNRRAEVRGRPSDKMK